jgi:hypothetical protein
MGIALSDRGNYICEWFGHRVHPQVIATRQSVLEQRGGICPFLSTATASNRACIKAAAAHGVCTISTLPKVGAQRQEWLVCPYRALDPKLVEDAVRRMFGLPVDQRTVIFPAPRLSDEQLRSEVTSRIQNGDRAFVYFDEKLGGELSIPKTDRSPEFSFDVTIFEIEREGKCLHIGRFGVIEIQTMDFHGSYRRAVANLKDGLRLHPDNFGETLQANQRWLADGIEGPNIANVFKRTFYQMMFKFQLGKSPRCAGCVLAIPISVWDSWQRHLSAPDLVEEEDGTFSLFKPGSTRPKFVPAWIYAFDLDSTASATPSPVLLSKIIATDAPSISFFALEIAPVTALDNIAAEGGMLTLVARRLAKLWPDLDPRIES